MIFARRKPAKLRWQCMAQTLESLLLAQAIERQGKSRNFKCHQARIFVAKPQLPGFAKKFTTVKMLLEDQRFIHEDLERLEQGIADRMSDEPKHVRFLDASLYLNNRARC